MEERPILALALLQGTQEIGYGTLYVYVGLFVLLIVGFVATTLVMARLIAPSRRSSRAKGQNYETGEVTVTDPWRRSEEHTSELQSRQYLVCRLLLEKKKTNKNVCRYILIKNITQTYTE